MTIEEMKQRKKELGYTCARLSELSGVPLSTVQKIFSGATPSPAMAPCSRSKACSLRTAPRIQLRILVGQSRRFPLMQHTGQCLPGLLPAKHPHPQLHRPPPVTISLHRITHSPPKS